MNLPLIGMSLNQGVRITIVAIVGILLFKLLAQKLNVGGLNTIAARV